MPTVRLLLINVTMSFAPTPLMLVFRCVKHLMIFIDLRFIWKYAMASLICTAEATAILPKSCQSKSHIEKSKGRRLVPLFLKLLANRQTVCAPYREAAKNRSSIAATSARLALPFGSGEVK